MSQTNEFIFDVRKARRSILFLLIVVTVFFALYVYFGLEEVDKSSYGFEIIVFAYLFLLIVFSYRYYRSFSKKKYKIEIRNDELFVPSYFLRIKAIKLSKVYSLEPIKISNKEIGTIFGVAGEDRYILEKDKFKKSEDYEACISQVYHFVQSRDQIKGIRSSFLNGKNGYLVPIISFVIIFIFLFFLGAKAHDVGYSNYIDYLLLGGNKRDTFLNFEIYRVASSTFLHSSLTHLLLNIFILSIFSELLGRIVGVIKVSNIFLLSSFFGVLFSSLFSNFDASVGASGGIFGLWGSYTYLKIKYETSLPGRFHAISLKKIYLILAIEILIEVFLVDSVDYFNHIGGFLTGYIYFSCIPLGRSLEFIEHPSKYERYLFIILLSFYTVGLSYFLLLYYGVI